MPDPSAAATRADGDSSTPTGRIGRDIIVIGTSAGGVEALTRLIGGLDPAIPAAIFVVQHFPATGRSLLPQILHRASGGVIPVTMAQHGQAIQYGQIYVAPADLHLLVQQGQVVLSMGPKENRCRPAVNPLFRSAARSYGARTIGVVLTGNLDDGTAGLQVIKAVGGVTVVQDPEEASFSGMPRSAVENVQPDHITTLSEIPDLLLRLSRQSIAALKPECVALPAEMEDVMDNVLDQQPPGMEERSVFTCPDCHGSMIETRNGGALTFRCHVGHVFSPESLAEGQSEMLEQALWTALASLEENIKLNQRMAARARERGQAHTADLYDKRLGENAGRVALLRKALYRGKGIAPPSPS